MKYVLLIAATTLALAGCKKAETTDSTMAPAASSSSAMAPAAATAKPMTMTDLVGTWTDTMADGTKGTTMFMADGTYHDTDPKGKVETGKFAVKNDKVCMTADAGANAGKEMCWATSAPAADGSIVATGDDGTKITVMKP